MKGYKTIIFGAILAALGSAQAADWTTIVPEQWTGVVMAVIGGLVMLLRKMTTTPLGKSE